MLKEPISTGGSSSSGTTGKDIEASSTSVKTRVENIERNVIGNRPDPEEVLPDDPKWERIGDRVIRRTKGSNRPEGVWPEVWQMTSHAKTQKLIKEAKGFREQTKTISQSTEATLEGIPPTDTGTGEGCWPGAPAVHAAASAGTQKEIVRHIVEFCTSEDSKIGDRRYTSNGCSVLRCSLADDVTTKEGPNRALEGA